MGFRSLLSGLTKGQNVCHRKTSPPFKYFPGLQEPVFPENMSARTAAGHDVSMAFSTAGLVKYFSHELLIANVTAQFLFVLKSENQPIRSENIECR